MKIFMYFDCFIPFLNLLEYEYQAKYNCSKALLKNVSLLELSGCFIQNDLSKITESLTEECCFQVSNFQMTSIFFYFFSKLVIVKGTFTQKLKRLVL